VGRGRGVGVTSGAATRRESCAKQSDATTPKWIKFRFMHLDYARCPWTQRACHVFIFALKRSWSRQSDSNRRPADYKSAALNQLSYAGVSPYESRFYRVHQELVITRLSPDARKRLIPPRKPWSRPACCLCSVSGPWWRSRLGPWCRTRPW
jgi:hypothetical protein